MTEKVQRELYLAIRKCCDVYKESEHHTDSYFIGALASALDSLLTAPQFNLKQLDFFSFMR